MKLPLLFPALFLLFLQAGPGLAQTPVRLAVLELVGDEKGEYSTLVREFARSSNADFDLIDEDLTRAASRGAGYSGSLNLSRDEARALGQSLGSDFYLLGKILVARRIGANNQAYFEALAGLFFVETRSGSLTLFAYEQAHLPDEQQARDRLKETIRRHWPTYAGTMLESRRRWTSAIADAGRRNPPPVEVLTDDLAAQGVRQPFFYQRLKPDYTEQADLAGITATVELEVVFREDGRIGEIEVVRWAGFGLDESAIATVKKLRFKPAEQAQKPLTIKGLVRYNFRRPLTQAERQEELERLKRSLRDLKQVPTQTSGQRPKP